jgi:hypothetical protein
MMKNPTPDRRSVCARALTRTAGRAFAASAAIFLFATGGLAGEVYGTFTTIGDMNVARAYHTATLLRDGKVLIAGGRRTWRDELDSAELYDPATHKFISTGKMTSARAAYTATLLPDGKVLIAGGSKHSEALASAELYDPVSGTFSPTGSMAIPRVWHTATLLANGRVLITGGESNQTGITQTAELYDPATGKFASASDMSVARALHYAAALNGGDVLIVGGVRGAGPNFFFSGHNYVASADLFDPAKGRFNSLSSPGIGADTVSNGSAVLLANGKVLIAGGIDDRIIVGGARLYDPSLQRFLPTGSMTIERFKHQATRLRDGRVLVTGGIKTFRWPAAAVASAELYDPQRGAFVRLPDMTTPRVYHTATLLPTGEVLITGGERGSFLGMSSAELYRPTSIGDVAARGHTERPETAIH